jgi:hypothetical protein
LGVLQFGFDHNFPEPIFDAVRPYLPFGGELLHRISEKLVDKLEDWQVILALHQMGYDGLITLDYEMLSLSREMAAVHQTKSTLVAIESAAHSPLRATGQLLLYASNINNAYVAGQPQVFTITKPRPTPPRSAWDCLGKIASDDKLSVQDTFDHARLSPTVLATHVIPGATKAP